MLSIQSDTEIRPHVHNNLRNVKNPKGIKKEVNLSHSLRTIGTVSFFMVFLTHIYTLCHEGVDWEVLTLRIGFGSPAAGL